MGRWIQNATINRLMRPHDKQSSELRRHAVKRFILSFIVYCMAMFTFYAVFDIFLSPAIGNIIANNTSNWEYIASDDIDSLWDEHTMIQFDTSPEEDPSIIRYRALDTYAMLKTAKDDALPMVFVLGIAGLIFYSLNKFVGYFSELSESIAALFRDKSSPIVLSEELKVVQTELRSIQKESLQNERDAIESEQRKNELVAYIAHDLRTPLTSILGYTSLLKGRNFEAEKQGCFLEIIHSEAQKMNAMLDDFFDITRLNVRNFLLEKQAIDLRTLCLQITDDFIR